MSTRVDHLVYATPDLERGVDVVERLLGVRATAGGPHPGRGTRNALVALGPRTYVEIIGPDPEQPAPDTPRPFGIDVLAGPRLTAWSAESADLDAVRSGAAAHGIALGPLGAGSRRRPDGVLLEWRFTDPRVVVADGLVPFFIDWGRTPHPAASAADGGRLVELRAEHPQPAAVQAMLDALGCSITVAFAPAAALVATLDGRRGPVELR